MKTALLALLLTSALSASPKTASRPACHTTDWSDVHAYIVDHAIAADANVEAALWSESVVGEKTWEVEGGRQSARVDGIGVGWPKTGEVIEVATASEAEELAGLIDDYRESQPE